MVDEDWVVMRERGGRVGEDWLWKLLLIGTRLGFEFVWPFLVRCLG